MKHLKIECGENVALNKGFTSWH